MKWLDKIRDYLDLPKLNKTLGYYIDNNSLLMREAEELRNKIVMLEDDLMVCRSKQVNFDLDITSRNQKIVQLEDTVDGLAAELRTVRNQLTTQRLVAQNLTVPSDQEHAHAERYIYLRNNFSMHNIRRAGKDSSRKPGDPGFVEGDYSGMNFQWQLPRWDPSDPTPEQLDKRLDEMIERHKSILKDKTRERK